MQIKLNVGKDTLVLFSTLDLLNYVTLLHHVLRFLTKKPQNILRCSLIFYSIKTCKYYYNKVKQ